MADLNLIAAGHHGGSKTRQLVLALLRQFAVGQARP